MGTVSYRGGSCTVFGIPLAAPVVSTAATGAVVWDATAVTERLGAGASLSFERIADDEFFFVLIVLVRLCRAEKRLAVARFEELLLHLRVRVGRQRVDAPLLALARFGCWQGVGVRVIVIVAGGYIGQVGA